MISNRWLVYTTAKPPKSCILILPGRAQEASGLAAAWVRADLQETLIIGITPLAYRWYPQPYSPLDQEEAVEGLPLAQKVIENVISEIESRWSIPRNKIVLAGFSAGGVMSVYVASHSKSELGGAICHAGAILDPTELPRCKYPDMPMILTHCQDDTIFQWHERYLPMVRSLEDQEYNLYTVEAMTGGHSVGMEDIQHCAQIIAPRLGYSEEWVAEHIPKQIEIEGWE